ncbi:MAG TPA: thiol:disulfide interchange protein [Prevotellaceae bacterium]|nr:thiol:disulfide interchange protein [Prevotellaceae bacterium]
MLIRNHTRGLLLLLLAALSACLPCQAQMQEPVKFAVTGVKTPGGKFLVRFTGQAEPGWHVYGTDIPEGGPTAATLHIDEAQGLKAEGALRATGKVHRAEDPMFGMTVSYMEGKATFEQAFTITAPRYSVRGYLTYGACSQENCMPPSNVEFSFQGEADVKAAASGAEPQAGQVTATGSLAGDTLPASMGEGTAQAGGTDLWAPVIRELHQAGSDGPVGDKGLLAIFLLGLLGGLVVLLTPCVWPVIPMTVSFFLKRSKDNRRQGVRDAMTYGVSIVVIYVLLGLLVTAFFGASQLNALSTNAVFNIFFFLLLLLFGTSFLGGFEISLPSRWTNAVDRKSESTSGLPSIFLMAFTLSLVSFSCTGPIIGFLLVEVSTGGALLAPTVGMLGFALALALPFTLFALFPAWLKSVPKSGGWMNRVKVCLGFVELAFSLKFLSVADLAYGWHILDRETFLALWIVIFLAMGCYLVGWLKFQQDTIGGDMGKPMPVPAIMLGLCSIAFAIYMVPGLWGAPCKAVSAFAPPISTQDFNLNTKVVEAKYTNYEEGMAAAKAQGKPVLLDFTGFGCVNCRKMEASVWTDPQVAGKLENDFVLISLFVDDKTPLAEPIEITDDSGQKRTLRTVGDKWSYLQRVKFGANAQPFYVLLDGEGKPLAPPYSFDESVEAYMEFLRRGLDAYGRRAAD